MLYSADLFLLHWPTRTTQLVQFIPDSGWERVKNCTNIPDYRNEISVLVPPRSFVHQLTPEQTNKNMTRRTTSKTRTSRKCAQQSEDSKGISLTEVGLAWRTPIDWLCVVCRAHSDHPFGLLAWKWITWLINHLPTKAGANLCPTFWDIPHTDGQTQIRWTTFFLLFFYRICQNNFRIETDITQSKVPPPLSATRAM